MLNEKCNETGLIEIDGTRSLIINHGVIVCFANYEKDFDRTRYCFLIKKKKNIISITRL